VTLIFLNGSAMAGQKDHGGLAGSTFVGPARTAARYRFFAVRDEFPGLFPVAQGGRPIVGELYDMPDDILHNSLLPSEPEELELGEIELEDGELVAAMLLRPERLKPGDKVVDIAELGGFRAYQAHLRSNQRLAEVLGRDDLNGERP
jgi:gamma-glutamylcyclotransferase (GGCT)/AIG2-like uncharacterized protein YtfP